jgi:hypothetical protein
MDRLEAQASIPASSREALSYAVHEEISKHYLIVSSLREHLNGLAPISKLSDDVLLIIFHFVADYEYPLHLGMPKFPSFTSRRAALLSVICRRWRNIALSRPNLWGQINQRDLSWMPRAWKRSRGGPLFVEWDSFDEVASARLLDCGPFLDVLEEMSRVQVLSLQLDAGELEGIEHLLLQNSPLLERLSIEVGRHGENEDLEDCLPQALIALTPSLRYLDLRHVYLPLR